MSGWRLRWKNGFLDATEGCLDGSSLSPHRLASHSASEVAAMPFDTGGTTLPLGEVFSVEPLREGEEKTEAPEQETLVLDGSTRLQRLGAGMTSGRLVIHGAGGNLLGAGARGGVIQVHGDAGTLVGAGMRGGQLHVEGTVGDLLGGPPPGARHGLAGGEIIVHGDAGSEVGHLQRRGLIAVAGCAGPLVGHEMRAGTIVVAAGDLVEPGVFMRRGSIIGLASRPPAGDGYIREGRVQLLWLRLLRRRLVELGLPLTDAQSRLLEEAAATTTPPPFEAWAGDTLALSRGEIIVPA